MAAGKQGEKIHNKNRLLRTQNERQDERMLHHPPLLSLHVEWNGGKIPCMCHHQARVAVLVLLLDLGQALQRF